VIKQVTDRNMEIVFLNVLSPSPEDAFVALTGRGIMNDIMIACQQAKRARAKRAWTKASKNIRVYYSKGPVVIFGILFPIFLFLSFAAGRNLAVEFLMPGLLGMVLFFTATSISPAVAPRET